jgi:hypothetical protein
VRAAAGNAAAVEAVLRVVAQVGVAPNFKPRKHNDRSGFTYKTKFAAWIIGVLSLFSADSEASLALAASVAAAPPDVVEGAMAGALKLLEALEAERAAPLHHVSSVGLLAVLTRSTAGARFLGAQRGVGDMLLRLVFMSSQQVPAAAMQVGW